MRKVLSLQNGNDSDAIYDGDVSSSVFLLDGPRIGDNGSTPYTPPDNGLGVSDKYIVSTENAVIEWTTITGAGKFETSILNFMKPLGAFHNVGDDRAIYDPTSGRFIFSCLGMDASDNYHYLVAVSKDGNPNDGWNFQSFDPQQPKDLPDQPEAATDGSNIYLISILPGGQQEALVTDGPGNFGSTSAYTRIDLGGESGVFRENAGAGRGDLLFARQGQTMTIEHINLTSHSADATSTVDLGSSVSAGEKKYTLPTPGTAKPIDAQDMQVSGSAYSHGFLYVTFEDRPQTGPDAGVPTAHWAKIDVRDPGHAKLVAQGNVSGAQIGQGVGTFNSSIAVDGAGDVLINFTATGPSLVPSDYYVVQPAGAPDGSFSKPVEIKASAGPYGPSVSAGSAAAVQPTRWGDYSSAVADPANLHAFWISNEYGTKAGSLDWGTATAHVTVNPATSGMTAMDLPSAGGPTYLPTHG